MSNQDIYKEDLLKEFIDPERIKKAPEGFTSKVMTLIQMEAIPSHIGVIKERNLIPYISAGFTLLLLAAALLIPGSKADSFTLAFIEIIGNLKISLPDVDLTSLFSFSLPSLLIYVLIGIFILILFDRALHAIFNREKKSEPVN